MNARAWILLILFAGLGLAYVVFFTEWLRPAPIGIASQIRFSVQPPQFGRVSKKADPNAKPTNDTNKPPPSDIVHRQEVQRIDRPRNGVIDQAPGGVANITFSFDDWYNLTRVRVEDRPADGSKPKVMWSLVGKSRPINSLLYRFVPDGMKPIPEGAEAEPLLPEIPYRLIVEAGRRRGTNDFKTTLAAPLE